jgi:hypothetical protein
MYKQESYSVKQKELDSMPAVDEIYSIFYIDKGILNATTLKLDLQIIL